jgi:hypothetical protein
LLIAAFYGLYSLVRDLHATESGLNEATKDAMHLISIERFFHVFQEQHVQHVVLSWHTYLEVWNTYYGTAHFVAVILVLAFLFFRHPERYPRWRNTLALATALALIGFAFFPVLPPRLLPPSYHFVDTLKMFGGPWNFSSGAVAEASNQYAAMPSLHTAWSTWCALAVLPLIRPWWGKVLICLYPVATIYGIVVTANHYFIDAAGGLVLLGIAYLLSPLVPMVFDRVRARVTNLRRRPATVASNGNGHHWG